MVFKGKYIVTYGNVEAYTIHTNGEMVIHSAGNRPAKTVDTNKHKVAIVDGKHVTYIKNGRI
jgi:hypothetical protein